MNDYGKCCVCQTPFKCGDDVKRIQTIIKYQSQGYASEAAGEAYDYCLKCYSVHIEKND